MVFVAMAAVVLVAVFSLERYAGPKRPNVRGSSPDPPNPPAARPAPSVQKFGKEFLRLSISDDLHALPAWLANRGTGADAGGIPFADSRLVRITQQEQPPQLYQLFSDDSADCVQVPLKDWPVQYAILQKNRLDARVILASSVSRGADAIVVRNSQIQRIEELAGNRIGILNRGLAKTLFEFAIDSSFLSGSKKESLRIESYPDAAAIREGFRKGTLDAAALSDPDLANIDEEFTSLKTLYSSLLATRLLYTVIVCSTEAMERDVLQGAFVGLIKGWLNAAEFATRRDDEVLDILARNLASSGKGAPGASRSTEQTRELFGRIDWPNRRHQSRFFGLSGNAKGYHDLYDRFTAMALNERRNSNLGLESIDPADTVAWRLLKRALPAGESSFPGEDDDSQCAAGADGGSMDAVLGQPVFVNFRRGSSELSRRARISIDQYFVPFIQIHTGSRFRIRGNSDSDGNKKVDRKLSWKRATAVIQYLTSQWNFSKSCFDPGNADPKEAPCDESKPDDFGVSLEQCKRINRSIRITVLQ